MTLKNAYYALSFLALVLGSVTLVIGDAAQTAACFSLAVFCRIGYHHAS